MQQSLLELKELACERDERALFVGLSVTVQRGDILQVVGPNGSGKTTLLRLITQMSDSFAGELCWCGEALDANRLAFLQNLLYIGHLSGIKKALTPRENLHWYAGLEVWHESGLGLDAQIDEALARVGMLGYEDVPCYQLSAGQKRRVALARLYLNRAVLWVLDEPFTAIDKTGVSHLENAIQAHAQRGGAVILTTHQDLAIPGVRRLDLADFRPTEEGEADDVDH